MVNMKKMVLQKYVILNFEQNLLFIFFAEQKRWITFYSWSLFKKRFLFHVNDELIWKAKAIQHKQPKQTNMS